MVSLLWRIMRRGLGRAAEQLNGWKSRKLSVQSILEPWVLGSSGPRRAGREECADARRSLAHPPVLTAEFDSNGDGHIATALHPHVRGLTGDERCRTLEHRFGSDGASTLSVFGDLTPGTSSPWYSSEVPQLWYPSQDRTNFTRLLTRTSASIGLHCRQLWSRMSRLFRSTSVTPPDLTARVRYQPPITDCTIGTAGHRAYTPGWGSSPNSLDHNYPLYSLTIQLIVALLPQQN